LGRPFIVLTGQSGQLFSLAEAMAAIDVAVIFAVLLLPDLPQRV
jgi:hypothetical protein